MQRKSVKECQAEFIAMQLSERIVAAKNIVEWPAERGWTEKEFVAAAKAERPASK